jgi:tetratricopeptide (TPR) repeat protein
MPTIEERLRAALLPDYEVHEELASGGMGMVFTAREVALDRLVAIKIIRPDLATAEAAERFLREARVLAQLRHPNVVSVHRAGEAGGFFYYVMDLVEGETLAQRMSRGHLTREETLKLGRDLLDALEAVHRLGIVHRDVKPANIFLVEGRALLADFGIARASGPQTVATDSAKAGVAGTPGYMPPEQAFGWEVTPQTDLYAAAMVLFEALTGERWSIVPERPSDWGPVPRRLAPILRRALDFDPRRRWPDARAFRHALWRTRTTKYRRRTLILTLSGLTVGAIAAFLLFGGRASVPHGVVVLPFEVEGDLDPDYGVEAALITHGSLVELDPAGFSYTRRLRETGVTLQEIMERANAPATVTGTLRKQDGGLAVQMWLTDRAGNRFESGVVQAASVYEFDGCRFGNAVVQLLAPQAIDRYRCPPQMQSDAVKAWVTGELAFQRQDWTAAESLFTEAIEYDSTFALAHWRRANARQWRRVPQSLNTLDQLYRDQGSQLSEVDRLLLDAWRTRFGPDRLRKYERAVGTYAHLPYAWMLFGDDLLMRGALMGVPLDSAQSVLKRATALDPGLGPAIEGQVLAAIRLGQADRARENIERLKGIAVVDAVVPPELYEYVWLERFAPERGELVLGQLASGQSEMLLPRLRWGLAFDIPAAQARVSAMMLGGPPLPPAARATLHAARSLALFALGRIAEAIVHLDSVAATLGTTEAQLVAAQWRVLPSTLGLPAPSVVVQGEGRELLETLVDDPAEGWRAAWVLGLDAYARGASLEARDWVSRVRGDSAPGRDDAERFLEGVRWAAAGEFDRALTVTDDLIPYDASEVTDPALRAALYLSRGQWRARTGDAPDRDWRWHENSDLAGGWPSGLPQAGEIDWAFSTYARLLRGRAALERNDRATGCPLLRRVLEVWQAPDAALEPLTNEARDLIRRRCSS